jgi:glycosyltransferase involved in cell wall biosynthesis
MRALREGWIAAKNLFLVTFVFCRRESRNVWNANFNREEYLVLNPDVARSVYPAALHFLIFGNRDPRNPSPRFSTRAYLRRHPEAGRAGINALVHFAASGHREVENHSANAIVRWPETEPLVSIAIRCSNSGEGMEGALQSALDQTFTGIEIIVVEGGSDDGSTRRKIRELDASGKSGVRVLYREAAGDGGDNRNSGIAAARGRYIRRLSAGERLEPTDIEIAVFQAEAFGSSTLLERRQIAPAPANGIADEAPLNPAAPPGQNRGVLFALPFLSSGGGVELLTHRVACWAKEAGWTPLIITTLDLPPEMPGDPSRFEGVTQRVYPLTALFPSDQEQLAFVGYLIQRYRVQLLVLGGSEAMYHWLPAIKAAYPDVTVADHLFNGFAHAHSNRQYRDYIDATVVQSECVMQEIQQRLGAPAGEAWRIPLGVEIPEAASLACESTPCTSGQRDIVIGYFGRLSREKGPDLFIEIASQLVTRHANLRFVIAGDGPEKEAVKKLIVTSRLGSVVEMPGFVEPVRPLMRRTDIVVLPSRIDGMPAAVLEAQALGIPVVASDIGGLPEVISDGETGYLCPSGAIGLFCDRIGELIRDPELRRRIGSSARRSVEQSHGIEQMKVRYLQLFQELGQGARLDSEPRPSGSAGTV